MKIDLFELFLPSIVDTLTLNSFISERALLFKNDKLEGKTSNRQDEFYV